VCKYVKTKIFHDSEVRKTQHTLSWNISKTKKLHGAHTVLTPLLFRISNHIKPVHGYPFHNFKIHFNSISPLCLVLQKTSFIMFPNKILYSYLFPSINALCGKKNLTLIEWTNRIFSTKWKKKSYFLYVSSSSPLLHPLWSSSLPRCPLIKHTQLILFSKTQKLKFHAT
jgi:hypothetical protein